MKRAYATLTLKSADDDARVIEGIASTPTPDVLEDIVESEGASYKLPIPLLWQHKADHPVGHVHHVSISKDGIKFKARLVKLTEEGPLKVMIDTAWQAVKAALVRGVSIGFMPTELSFLDTGGVRYIKWKWLELSLVTIPANLEATIQTIKSVDSELLAASGRPLKTTRTHTTTPAASGKISKRTNVMAKKSLSEQISEWQNTRNAKSAEMARMIEEGEGDENTFDASEKESFDELVAEIREIDAHVDRLKVVESLAVKSARPVDPNPPTTTEHITENPRHVQATVKPPKPEKGIRFARYAKCIAVAHKDHRDIEKVAETLYGQVDPEFVSMIKAAVPAMTTGNMSALIGNEGAIGDFVEYMRPLTIIGRLGTDGIPDVTRVPFRIPLISETAESEAYWVGEGKAKPLTNFTVGRTELAPLKVATIAVQTMELIRDSSPSSDTLVRNSLARAVAKRIDQSFIDPDNAGTANVSPASILNGVTGIASGGQDIEAIRADAAGAMAAFATANNPLNSGVWIMSSTTALWLSLMMTDLGTANAFPGMTVRGGNFLGMPTLVSNYVGDFVALVNAEDVWVADDGEVDIAMSTDASLEMSNTPTQDSGAATPVGTAVVSMFQTNSAAFRAERSINWARRRAGAVSWISGVTWGQGAS
jgi:HK97 family phage major capsid protein/HK97 family phage prohead protease